MPTNDIKVSIEPKGKRKVPLFFCAENSQTKDLYEKLKELFVHGGSMTEARALAEAKNWGKRGKKLDLVISFIGFLAKEMSSKKPTTDDASDRRFALLVAAQAQRDSNSHVSIEGFQESFRGSEGSSPWTFSDDLYADVPAFRLLPALNEENAFKMAACRYNQSLFRDLARKSDLISRSDAESFDAHHLNFDELEAFFKKNKNASLHLKLRSKGEVLQFSLKYKDLQAIFA